MEKLNKSETLSILGFHEERLKNNHIKPGWSKWALYGSLASLIWLFLILYQNDQIVINDGLKLFVGLFLFYQLQSLVIKSFEKSSITKTIYQNKENTSSSKIILFNIFNYLGIFYLSNYIFILNNSYLSIINVFTISISVIFAIALISIYYSDDVVVETNSKLTNWVKRIFGLLFIISLTLSILIFLSNIQDIRNINLIKTGLIFFGLYFIVEKLIEHNQELPLIYKIEELIDDVTFDKIDHEDALKRLRLIIIGSELKESMAPYINNFLELNESYFNTATEVTKRIEQYLEANEELRVTIEDSVRLKVDELDSISIEINKKLKKLNQKLASAKFIESDKIQYNEILTLVTKELEKSTKKHNELRTLIENNSK